MPWMNKISQVIDQSHLPSNLASMRGRIKGAKRRETAQMRSAAHIAASNSGRSVADSSRCRIL